MLADYFLLMSDFTSNNYPAVKTQSLSFAANLFEIIDKSSMRFDLPRGWLTRQVHSSLSGIRVYYSKDMKKGENNRLLII